MIYKYRRSQIEGVFELYPNYFEDERGSVLKTFHKESYEELGLDCNFGESLITTNKEKDTIRGFHFQKPPYTQAKTICCIQGSIFDVVLDLRCGSPTYGKTEIFNLDAKRPSVLYLPVGVANCYLVQTSNTVIAYNLTSKYMPEYDSGIRWDSVGVPFPVKKPIVSTKDASFIGFESFVSPFVYGGL